MNKAINHKWEVGKTYRTRGGWDAMTMTPEQVEEFKREAKPFEYSEQLGTIKGYRNRDGKVLITESTLSA